ncbi:EH domain-containing protein 1 isoform X3 [Gossypium hirsutum]|uniref:EH domain-containing protein 1-like isoform X1 n=1 Tax=Gossypium hirsutum TaxID=3635 RepID=A0A1U8M621_GOSHI|nr:EH domain-containing protein 1-like isoform X3 [Gossypium hirsutum]XP_016722258.1 EH domain-containing protein 1-like isoform X3 [Gossypium hirsutum]XP_016722260.1 EH domain-containing protein 1-like isoform X3 [Gossypium hirsutum]XP_016722261.1 EH domain-containing protein 1-like isoform X3 [Gossypium hirsutum]
MSSFAPNISTKGFSDLYQKTTGIDLWNSFFSSVFSFSFFSFVRFFLLIFFPSLLFRSQLLFCRTLEVTQRKTSTVFSSAMEIGIGRIGSCSKEHQKIYQEWFNFADSDNDGRITGNDAIKFFGMSNLPRPDLKQVWATADSKRLGFLGFKEFVFAMQLVSLAQEGHQISHVFLNVDFENIRPPVMEGLDTLIMRKKQSSKSSSLESNGMTFLL